MSRFVRNIGKCLRNYTPPHPTEKMEAAVSSKKLINYYGTMRLRITEDGQQPPLWEPYTSQQTGGAYNPFLQNQGCLLLSPEWVVNEGFLSRKQNMWLTASHRVQEFGVRNRKDSVIPHNLNSQSLLQDYSWVNKPRGEGSPACMHSAMVCNRVSVHSHYCTYSSTRTLLQALIFCTRIFRTRL